MSEMHLLVPVALPCYLFVLLIFMPFPVSIYSLEIEALQVLLSIINSR
jgi:hypothetical protein